MFLINGLLKRGLVNPDRLVHTLLTLMKRMIDLIIICVETLKQVCRCLLENKFTERDSLKEHLMEFYSPVNRSSLCDSSTSDPWTWDHHSILCVLSYTLTYSLRLIGISKDMIGYNKVHMEIMNDQQRIYHFQ